MRVYTVFSVGNYRQQCVGIFSSEELAINAAKEFATLQHDNWHSFEVVPFDLDEKSSFESKSFGTGIIERLSPIFTTSKKRVTA